MLPFMTASGPNQRDIVPCFFAVSSRMLRWLWVPLGKHEIGVIERYASVISALDDHLEAREGDDFVSWLSAQGLASVRNEHEPEHARDVKEGSKEGAGAGGRAKTEKFLVAAAARLNSLVADQEDMLFRDRGEGEKGATTETAAAPEEATAQGEVASPAMPEPAMPEEDLYQVRYVSGCMIDC